jgi:hypothetical protein
MFCTKCAGMGEYMGNGMMLVTCPVCFGHGHRYDDEETIKNSEEELLGDDLKIDRKSKSYRESIKKIMAVNSDITHQDAVKMFEKEYKRL